MSPKQERMRETVAKMFEMVKRDPKQPSGLDERGIPNRLKAMAEAVYTSETTFSVPGKGPQSFSGDRESYYKYNIERMEKTEGKQKLELLDMLFGESYAAGLIRYTDERGGEMFTWLRINAYQFNDAGDRIVAIKTYEHDQYGVDSWFEKSLQ